MDDKENELLKVITGFADRLVELFDLFANSNMENVNEFVKEQTYRPSNLYITLNIGIISGSTILFSLTNGDIKDVSKILFLGVAFSFVSIALEVFNHKQYLQILESDAYLRAGNADKRRKELGDIMKDYHENGFQKSFEDLGKLTSKLDEENKNISEKTKAKMRPVHFTRKLSIYFIIAALMSLFGIGISEMGVLQVVGDYFTDIELISVPNLIIKYYILFT